MTGKTTKGHGQKRFAQEGGDAGILDWKLQLGYWLRGIQDDLCRIDHHPGSHPATIRTGAVFRVE
jgi:hypothetical protein